jgi:anthranilate phosphoribosyltransferase
VPALADGVGRAQDAVDSGRARATLDRLVEASNERADGQESQ